MLIGLSLADIRARARKLIRSAGIADPSLPVVFVVDTDGQLFSRTFKTDPPDPFGVPSNGWFFINNLFGKGSLVNGVNYTSKLATVQAQFPFAARQDWDFGNGGGTGIGSFAYGYPALAYVSNPYGDADGPFNEAGRGFPRQVNQTGTFKIAYNISVGGNLNSYNTLIDAYVTLLNNSASGAFVLELSYFPTCNPTLPFVGTATHTFNSIGKCRVGLQGTQACFYPCSPDGTQHRNILAGEVDFEELALYAIALGWGGMTGNEYWRGFEFGPEIQVPSVNNSGPYNGWLLHNAEPIVTMSLSNGTPQVAPSNRIAPAISGTPTVGQLLTCSSGTWIGSPAPTFSYQWKRNGTNLPGATASTYTPVSADNLQDMTCDVTATNANGSTTQVSNTQNINGITRKVTETWDTQNGWSSTAFVTYASQRVNSNVGQTAYNGFSKDFTGLFTVGKKYRIQYGHNFSSGTVRCGIGVANQSSVAWGAGSASGAATNDQTITALAGPTHVFFQFLDPPPIGWIDNLIIDEVP